MAMYKAKYIYFCPLQWIVLPKTNCVMSIKSLYVLHLYFDSHICLYLRNRMSQEDPEGWSEQKSCSGQPEKIQIKTYKMANIQNYALQWCFKSVLLAKGNVGVSARGETIKSLSNLHHHHFPTKCLMKNYDYHHSHYSHDDQNTLIVVEVSTLLYYISQVIWVST